VSAEWSGQVTVDSLPHEFRAKQSRNIRALQAALGTPNPQVTEAYTGRPAGFGAFVEAMVGGGHSVHVDTLSPLRTIPSFTTSAPTAAIDPWTRNHLVNEQWGAFFTNYMNGRMPVRESLPAYSRPCGPVSYGGRNRQRNRPVGVPPWYKPLPGEPAADMDPSREEARLHDGPCGSVHPYQTHRDWAASEEEEERRRIKSKYFEAVEGARDLGKAHESTTPVREGRGWKWCSTHQRWTRN